jgi:hypothetical protein
MTFHSRPRAATLAALAVTGIALSLGAAACSSENPATASASSKASARTTATARPTASSKAPSGAVGAETPEAAKAEVATLIAAQNAAAAQPGTKGKALREAAYVGQALAAATAQGKLVSTLTAAQKADLALSAQDPVVLAVSRTAAYPRVILAKTTFAGSGSPAVITLVSSAAGAGYRIASIARMLPSASVGKFDALAAGSAPVGDAAGLAIAPEAVLAAYSEALAYPAPAAADGPFTEDAFFAAVRKGAADQAAALGTAVTLKQTHAPAGIIAALRAAAGQGAYAVAVIERKDSLTEKTANGLSTSKAFAILSGKSVVTKTAVLKTYEFVVIHIPVTGKATVVAAAEQLYAASGT